MDEQQVEEKAAAVAAVRFTGEYDDYRQPLAWVNGVPARDLTADEWLSLSDEQRALCLSTGLYEVLHG